MSLENQITHYLESIPEPKCSEMKQLHALFLEWIPNCKLWFESGIDANNKVVSNPNIGYGNFNISYANGTTREFYQIGLSANTTGISVYIMGIRNKIDLVKLIGPTIGKAKVTGYCIKFKTIKDIDLIILREAILLGTIVPNLHSQFSQIMDLHIVI